MIKIITLLAFIIMPITTMADGIANHFQIEKVRVDKTGRGYIQFASDLVNSPADCGSNYKSSLAFDTNTEGGKAIMALALATHASNKKVYAKGTGECTIYSDVIEDYSWGYIE